MQIHFFNFCNKLYEWNKYYVKKNSKNYLLHNYEVIINAIIIHYF